MTSDDEILPRPKKLILGAYVNDLDLGDFSSLIAGPNPEQCVPSGHVRNWRAVAENSHEVCRFKFLRHACPLAADERMSRIVFVFYRKQQG